ncbi:DUF4652 domain-containing protein [Ureibacillus manganicus]|uniref:Uncharacterized protein n=1 Tax=Ureibacillus manganicus DSM 26584 TaxID=1384049 RepID=A0A0A3HMB4_9BACL|nr:DUF4652 domain-containing protein [Ureibacillus manganicus]KGR73514.1 hypothetical protein CD29_19940 [Ureibacillus manganicus DSM 26584]
MNEIKKQLLAKMGDTSDQKNRVIRRVNEKVRSKPQKQKKIALGYYVTFASFIAIFVVGLLFIPKLMNEQTAQNEDNTPIIEPEVENPVKEPVEDQGYYNDLKQFFPPDGTIATFKGGDFYTNGLDIETNWLSDRYVQEIIYAKDCESCSTPAKSYVYRITDEEIQRIYDGHQLEWTTQELDQLPSLGVELKGPIEVGTEIGAQKIVSIDAELTTDYGTFTNVVVVEGGVDPTTPEMHSIEYYVPNYGIVKRDTEGFWHSELVSISFDNEVADNESNYNNLLKSYFFPSENSDAFYIGGFENGGEKVQTKWLNDEFVQEITSNGGATIERIYHITNNQIELIYQEMIDGSSPSSMTTEQLNQLPTIEIVMTAPFKVGDTIGEFTVIDTKGEVGTMYNSFSDVLILENKDEESITRKYYAKGYGKVKLEFEFYNQDTREFELSHLTELSSFGPIMKELEGNIVFRVFEADQMDFHSVDETEESPLKTKRAILHGRGVDFEGINQLTIEDLENGKYTIYKYRNEAIQFTPKEVEWIDENRLYVIVGYGYGTVTKGGQLYELNLVNNSIKQVFGNLSDKEEIMTISSNGDGSFTYKKHIYVDDNYDVGREEEGNISPK